MRVRDDCEEAPIALLNDFEKALREDKELVDKFNSLSKELAAAGELSEYEVFAQAAGKLGYDISITDIELARAECQELDDETLDTVAGGRWCWYSNLCVIVFNYSPYDSGI